MIKHSKAANDWSTPPLEAYDDKFPGKMPSFRVSF